MTDVVHLEEHRPLSQSLIWEVEREAYREQGVDGWRQGTVPHYITTNPFIAGSYASVALGFLRDCAASDGFDSREPVHIVELGAGPGRFGYHLLTQLLDLRDHSRLADVPVRYVMTDLAESNVAFWSNHEKLKPLVDAGVLDFARFDIEHDSDLHLMASGDIIRPGHFTNPGMVIANYVFDSVPQDCYRTERDHLVALLAAATSTQPEPDVHDPGLLERLALSFVETEVDAGRFGLDPSALAVLDSYRERLGATMVLWPSIAIRCLRRLRALWNDRLVLLSGDKGFSREGDLLSRGEPDVVPHGAVFSLMVNFHAIGEWFVREGGVVRHPPQRHASLNISLCASGFDEAALAETTGAYHASMELTNPDDFFSVVLTPEQPATTLEEFLAVLRLSRWDADALLRHLPGVAGELGQAPVDAKEELAWTVRKVWDSYYPIGEALDVPFYIGMLFYELGWYGDAIDFLEQSLDLYGPAGETFYNIALCHYAARELERAVAYLQRAAEFPESLDGAKALRLRIDAERARFTPVSERRGTSKKDQPPPASGAPAAKKARKPSRKPANG